MAEQQIVNGGSAFPSTGIAPGMTLRDWFAGQALVAIIGFPETQAAYRVCATRAYAIADAMLEARIAGVGWDPALCGLCGTGLLISIQDHAESLCGPCRAACGEDI